MKKANTNIVTRKTKQREAILKVLKSTDVHPTAQWVYEQVRQELPHISLGTVYRDLKMLKEKGEIKELEFGGSQNRFDGNTEKHSHFCCIKCNGIYDIDEPISVDLDKRVAEENKLDIHYHRIKFFGLCRNCRQQE